ncbi:MAG: hypothetical protein CL467_05405 [Acidimicrobiaceae bacterium]|nr:hypothetical protein [Acidimicrobiaceae bacterium]HAQ23448.1 hypothetical protein [Acidimicrobiaceae bacterium]|tara:strand:- start:2954 stop:3790 length:837 start_codon:yes stop_codon:yes gene_type:complete
MNGSSPSDCLSYVALVGGDKCSLYTLRCLIESEHPPAGVVVVEQSGFSSRLASERRVIRRHGILRRLSQIVVGIIHRFLDGARDRELLEQIYPDEDHESLLQRASLQGVGVLKAETYHSVEALSFIREFDPAFLVCDTPFWVEKKVRELVPPMRVIGSHPGVVPWYRGAHSAFWCRYLGESEKNGFSIFCIDGGVDSGPLISTHHRPYRGELSYRGNDYFLLEEASRRIVQIAESLAKGLKVEPTAQWPLENEQIRRAPGLLDYFRFRARERSRLRAA